MNILKTASLLNVETRTRDPVDNTEFKSIYLKLRLLTDEIDASGEKYNPAGVTNLRNGTGNVKVQLQHAVQMDKEHSSHYAKRNGVKISHNAGDIVELWTETDETGITALYGTARVGIEHVLYDENNQITGSAYASAWLTYAQQQVNQEQKGSVKDYIPTNIWEKYFENQLVIPFKGLSVEIAHIHYKASTLTDLNGITHINKSDLIRVAWILNEREGQAYSRIEDIKIKTIKTNMNTIKCLCEAEINTQVIKDNQVFEVLETDASNHKYLLKNIVTDEEITINSQEEALEYTLTSELEDDVLKTVIKTCNVCAELKKKNAQIQEELDKKLKTDETTINDNQTDENLKTTEVDMAMYDEKLSELTTMLANANAKIEELENRLIILETPKSDNKTDEKQESEITQIKIFNETNLKQSKTKFI
jgi:hypothetical protein